MIIAPIVAATQHDAPWVVALAGEQRAGAVERGTQRSQRVGEVPGERGGAAREEAVAACAGDVGSRAVGEDLRERGGEVVGEARQRID